MFRKGIITLLHEDGSGIITDENEQEIEFKVEKKLFGNLKGARVSFEIELKSNGLVAMNLQVID